MGFDVRRWAGAKYLEPGAHITGQLRAENILVGGEVHGNIQATSRVELLKSGNLIGDVKGGSLTVAAGSRMQGRVESGSDHDRVKLLPGSFKDPGTSLLQRDPSDGCIEDEDAKNKE